MYNLSLRRNLHLNSQQSYYSSATQAHFWSKNQICLLSLFWEKVAALKRFDLSAADGARLALQVAALVRQTSSRLLDT